MNTKTLLRIAAAVVALPAFVLLLNLGVFAFCGAGFLSVGDGDVNSARAVVAGVSAFGAAVLVGTST